MAQKGTFSLSSPCPLVLGTAQLGLPYGISNRSGKPDRTTALKTVKAAWDEGIREYDTAQGYGDSESILGEALYRLGVTTEAKVITKLDPRLDFCDFPTVERALHDSLDRLRIPKLYGLLLHREAMLTSWNAGLCDIFSSFVSSGVVQHIGISIYSPEKAIAAVNTEGIDIVQLPANILDRRFENTGVFDLSRSKGKQIYTRSVFLQGLFFLNPHEIPNSLLIAKPLLEKITQLKNDLELQSHELALGYIKEAYKGIKVILGSENPVQVLSNCTAWRKSYPSTLIGLIKETFPAVHERILNPALW
jgi:aryl-alcohol dehydrogenase-like predicted oxidoreductase